MKAASGLLGRVGTAPPFDDSDVWSVIHLDELLHIYGSEDVGYITRIYMPSQAD